MSEGDVECFELFREIRRVGAKLSRERDEDLKVLQLTGSQSLALLYLEQNPRCQITDLSAHLEISHQAARTLVDRLRTKELVDVDVSDSDGRARSITLTDIGAEKCAEIRRVRLDTASHSLSSLTHEERMIMLSLLDKISRNLQRGPPSIAE